MGKKITSTEATKLCDNFDAKYSELTKFIGKDDNRSILFTIEELENYISYLKKSEKKIDGIRVYLGSYGADEKKSSNNELTTVFLAPTSSGVDNTNLKAFNLGETGIPPSKKYGK